MNVVMMAPITNTRIKKAAEDRHRQTDEEHLHLRHQARENAEPDIEEKAEHEKRRRKLDADAKRDRHVVRHQRGDVAERQGLPGLNRL